MLKRLPAQERTILKPVTMISILRQIAGKLGVAGKLPLPESDPETAYDQWAFTYDSQPDNLVLHLEKELFGSMLQELSLNDKIIADIGCGTGRHWPLLFSRQPASLTGFDVSARMLQVLLAKYPQARTIKLDDASLLLPDASCDIILSTLALAHMPDAITALHEWLRVLKPGGDLLITDFHPEALQQGEQRTFLHNGKWMAVENHIYPLEMIRSFLKIQGLSELQFREKYIDAAVRNWYEKKQALAVYERSKGIPVIYGLHVKKNHAAA